MCGLFVGFGNEFLFQQVLEWYIILELVILVELRRKVVESSLGVTPALIKYLFQ